MAAGDVGALLREMMMVILKIGGPLLAVSLAVGLVVSLIQAATQINEATLIFAPKVLAICVALLLLGPFMRASLFEFTTAMFDRMVAIGGS